MSDFSRRDFFKMAGITAIGAILSNIGIIELPIA